MVAFSPPRAYPSVNKALPKAKPFLKWAGGKSQLINQIKPYLPPCLGESTLTKYAEPFIGGGAVFFFMVTHFPLRHAFISDTNKDLILAYQTIQREVESLIDLLAEKQHTYSQMKAEQRKAHFYEVRRAFNEGRHHIDYSLINQLSIRRTADLIFLNRTCFNGLYRVNSKGAFNVPFGRYKKPKICAARNLRAVSQVLAHTEIHPGDFATCQSFVDDQTLIYFDPPYRPISQTASFNAYSAKSFDDQEQARLAAFCRQVHHTGAKLMVSNSDPHNEDPDDNFFQELYAGFTMRKLSARRAINSNGTGRGEITELLITNY